MGKVNILKNKIKCLLKHDYEYLGSYYQECKPKKCQLFGVEIFKLHRCNNCGKYYKEDIQKYYPQWKSECEWIVDFLKDSGYKHINTYCK